MRLNEDIDLEKSIYPNAPYVLLSEMILSQEELKGRVRKIEGEDKLVTRGFLGGSLGKLFGTDLFRRLYLTRFVRILDK